MSVVECILFLQLEGDGIHLSNQPGIVYLQTTVTNEAGEVTQQMIPVQTSALQVSRDSTDAGMSNQRNHVQCSIAPLSSNHTCPERGDVVWINLVGLGMTNVST